MSHYDVNIWQYCQELEKEWLEDSPFQGGDTLLDFQLFVKQSTDEEAEKDPHWIAELLITCGGPTVKVTVDSRSMLGELFHSWGGSVSGEKRTTIVLSVELTNQLKEEIEGIYL